MRLNKKLAKTIGLPIVPLLTFDFSIGNPRVIKPRETVANLVYSLDEFEISTKVLKNETGSRKPPDVFSCPQTNLPLRPLYFDRTFGKIMRAIPLNWREGVPYHQAKSFLNEKES